MKSRPATTPTRMDSIQQAVKAIMGAGQIAEFRAVNASTPAYRRPHVESGYFDAPERLAAAANAIEEAEAFYFTPNPLDPALLARAKNRIRPPNGQPATSDRDVVRRRWMLVDIDPVRPTGISASDEEHEAALARAREIRESLAAEGWPQPILADSGNGAHLLYSIDLPTDDGGLVKHVLQMLAFRFDDSTVTVDTSCHNPGRLVKLYGTVARKGDSTSDRPHRRSGLIDVPETIQAVSEELLHQLAESLPSTTPTSTAGRRGGRSSFDLESWIQQHDLDVIGPGDWQGGRKWIFRTCPWSSEHTNRSAYILQLSSGAIAAGCLHNSCRQHNWHSLRDLIEPGWRDKAQPAGGKGTFVANVAFVAPSHSEQDGLEPVQAGHWPDRPDDAAYHGLAGEIVGAIEPHTEADPVALMAQFLVAFGNTIGKGAHFTVDGSVHHMNMFAVLVGRTSKARKGTSWSRINRLLANVDPDWAADRIQSGLSSGEGLIWGVRDPITRREPLKDHGKFTGEYQDIQIDPGIEDKRLLVFEGEFASVLKVLNRDGNTLSAIIRQAWDSGDLRSLTKNSPAKATGAHISIVGHITQAELKRWLSTTEAASGFGNRFLWICAKRSKCLPDGGNLDEVGLGTLCGQLQTAVKYASTADEIVRDDPSRAVWRQVYPTLSEGKPGLLGAMTSRAEAQVMRLAAIYALLDCSSTIRPEHLMAALALWEYCEASAQYIFGDAMEDPVADELLKLLRANPNGISRTDIRDYFGRHRSSRQISRALGVLAECDLAHQQTENTGGRPTERWFAGVPSAT